MGFVLITSLCYDVKSRCVAFNEGCTFNDVFLSFFFKKKIILLYKTLHVKIMFFFYLRFDP